MGKEEQFHDDLCVDTGLLEKESIERYAFMHLSFVEYFTAEYIAEKESWEILFENYKKRDERLGIVHYILKTIKKVVPKYGSIKFHFLSDKLTNKAQFFANRISRHFNTRCSRRHT
jgi:hypothetical protein